MKSSLTVLGFLLTLSLLLSVPQAWAGQPRNVTGSVSLQQVQMAVIGSAGGGSGHLSFHGKSYLIKVAGLGVGGIGVSKLTATGQVYDLYHLSDFEGLYVQIRLGWAIANRGGGILWLRNAKGVILRLKTQRKGLMFSGGADGVSIRFAH